MTAARYICAVFVLAALGFGLHGWSGYSSAIKAGQDASALLDVHRQLARLTREIADLRSAALINGGTGSRALVGLINDIDAALALHVSDPALLSSWRDWRQAYSELPVAGAAVGEATHARMQPFSHLSLLNDRLAQIASGLRFELFQQWQPGSDAKVAFELTLASAQRVLDLAGQVAGLARVADLQTPLYSRLGALRVETDKVARFYDLLDVAATNVQPPAVAALQQSLIEVEKASSEHIRSGVVAGTMREADAFASDALTYAEALIAAAAEEQRNGFLVEALLCALVCVLAPLVLFAYERQRLANDVTRNQLGNALTGLDVGSWTRDLMTHEVVWSPELRRIFGYGPEVADTTLTPLVYEDDRDEMERRLSVLLTAPIQDPPVRQQFDVRIYHPSGELRWVSSVVAKTRLANGHPGLVGVLINTHERHMTEERLTSTLDALARRNEEMHFFTRSTAHDLMEPVRVAHSFAKMLAEDSAGKLSDDSEDYLKYLLEATDRAKQTLTRLREYLALGQLGEPVMVNLDEVLAEVLRDLDERIQTSGGCVVRCPLPAVMGHRVAMKMLFFNVLSNAIHYTPAGQAPEVSLTAEEQGGYLHLVISDNGIGMDEEHLEAVFRPFRRLHPRSEFPGVGLGLSLSRRAVEFSGGEIWLDSTPDHGTRVHIRLPLALQGEMLQQAG